MEKGYTPTSYVFAVSEILFIMHPGPDEDHGKIEGSKRLRGRRGDQAEPFKSVQTLNMKLYIYQIHPAAARTEVQQR